MRCEDKIKYLTATSARSIVNRMKKQASRRRVRNQLLNPPKLDSDEHDNLEVYKCNQCTFYHVGHDRVKPETPAAATKTTYESCLTMMVEKRLIALA